MQKPTANDVATETKSQIVIKYVWCAVCDLCQLFDNLIKLYDYFYKWLKFLADILYCWQKI